MHAPPSERRGVFRCCKNKEEVFMSKKKPRPNAWVPSYLERLASALVRLLDARLNKWHE